MLLLRSSTDRRLLADKSAEDMLIFFAVATSALLLCEPTWHSLRIRCVYLSHTHKTHEPTHTRTRAHAHSHAHVCTYTHRGAERLNAGTETLGRVKERRISRVTLWSSAADFQTRRCWAPLLQLSPNHSLELGVVGHLSCNYRPTPSSREWLWKSLVLRTWRRSPRRLLAAISKTSLVSATRTPPDLLIASAPPACAGGAEAVDS